jgi:hypothetical protein
MKACLACRGWMWSVNGSKVGLRVGIPRLAALETLRHCCCSRAYGADGWQKVLMCDCDSEGLFHSEICRT